MVSVSPETKSVGVPEIIPVELANCKPLGRLPLVMLQDDDWPPLLVGIIGEIAKSLVGVYGVPK